MSILRLKLKRELEKSGGHNSSFKGRTPWNGNDESGGRFGLEGFLWCLSPVQGWEARPPSNSVECILSPWDTGQASELKRTLISHACEQGKSKGSRFCMRSTTQIAGLIN